MDTIKMVAEMKTECSALEKEKASVMARLRQIEEELSSYYNAIDSLNKIMPKQDIEEPKPEKKKSWSRNPVYLECNGERLSVPQWAKRCGITPSSLRHRLNKGWSVEDAVTKPASDRCTVAAQKKKMRSKVFMYDAHGNILRQYTGTGDASKDLNLPVATIEKIIAKMTKDDQLRCRNYYLAYAG